MTLFLWNVVIWYELLLFHSLTPNFDPAVAEMTARLYFNYIELCTSADNSFAYRTQILYDLCENPQINITSDLPESPGESTEMNVYLNELNKIAQTKKYSIVYEDKINITQCRYDNSLIWACQATKHITYKGTTKTFDEVLELALIGGKYKIVKVHSNYIRAMVVDCSNLENNEDIECNIVELAKEEYTAGRVELAVAYLGEATMCGINFDEEDVAQIKTINIDSIYRVSLEKGKALMQAGQYTEALTYFYSIQRSYQTRDSKFNDELINKIENCKLELDYLSFIEQGDFLYKQLNFKESLKHYINASNIKSSVYLDGRISQCKEMLRADYERTAREELATVDELVRSNQKDQATAFRIIMKYRYSGALVGKHFFYAAQIAESPPASIKNEFELVGRNQCLFTRQMLLNAHGRGYYSEGFKIYWDEYLTEKTRTCD